MKLQKYPDNQNGRNDAIDTINNVEDIDGVLSADNSKSLIDGWIDLFSWYPPLWGPNGDKAKAAINNSLSGIVNHKNALKEAMKQLPNYNPNDGTPPTNPDDGIPPKDPTPPTPPRRDPLVLDSDKDGFISTVALADSNTYFDITGDGIKEKVSWIGANDGILTYDKNENGKIDGIDEVFGNLTTSGFDELKQLIDSNYDGVIDRKDELYSRLKVMCQPYIILIHKHFKLLFQPVASFFLQTRQVTNYYLNYAFSGGYNELLSIQKYSG